MFILDSNVSNKSSRGFRLTFTWAMARVWPGRQSEHMVSSWLQAQCGVNERVNLSLARSGPAAAAWQPSPQSISQSSEMDGIGVVEG